MHGQKKRGPQGPRFRIDVCGVAQRGPRGPAPGPPRPPAPPRSAPGPAPNTGFLTIAAGGGNHSLGLRGTLGTPALHLNVDAAYKPGSSHWTISSDRRLKQKVQPLHGALDRLLGLHGVTFEWRDPLTQGGRFGPQIGLIADEVARVFPAWVGNGPGGYQTLTVCGFEALTAEALRDLRAEKDAQIEQLRCENAELHARLLRLEELLSNGHATPAGEQP